MPLTVPKSWQCPSAEEPEKYRLGWLDEQCQDGERWIKSQRGVQNAQEYRRALDIISGREPTREHVDGRGRITGKRLKTNIRVSISGLSNIRPIWGWHAAKAYADYASMMNKTARALYLEGSWDRSVKEVLAWAAATCTGWMRPVYMRDQAGRGRGSIKLLTYGMPSVLPTQVPMNGDFQEAYAMTLLDEVPIYMAHSKFPDFQDRLKPTSSRYWYAAEIRGAAKQNAWQRASSLFRKRDTDEMADTYIPIRWTTVIDNSHNLSGHTLPMGEPGSPWYYEVPSLGQEISAGRDEHGHELTRKANENDARMYPYRRLFIASQDCIMYDGPAFNWHGQCDLIPFALDKWPWEPIGFSLVHDGWALQEAIDEIDNGAHTKITAEMNMPLAYDLNAVTLKEAKEVDPFEPNGRYGYDGNYVDGKPFQSVVGPEVYQISPQTLAMRKEYQEELDYQLQVRDIVELGKARALGKGMDQIEALVAANGPVVRDMCRDMEMSLGKVGEQVGWLVLQYENTARLMQIVGPESMDNQVFDYNPADITPSHLPDETVHDPITEAVVPSKYSQAQRARWFAENVRYYLMPHSAHEITQMAYRLMLLQGRQRGLPISAATTMQSMEIPDVGIPDGNTEQERFYNEKEVEIHHAARIQAVIMAEAIENNIVEALGGKPSGSTKSGGRPPSNKTAPHQEVKSGGRPIVSTSE